MITKRISHIFKLCSKKYFFKRHYTNRNIMKLRERGIFQDIFPDTSMNEVTDILNGKPQTVYAGFDPTADSLHVGNLLVLISLIHWQRAGHQVIAVIGGATSQVGDPSGHLKDRLELSEKVVEKNSLEICKNIEQVFRNHEDYLWKAKGHTDTLSPVIIVNNETWYRQMNVIQFVGGIARQFRMGSMLSRSSVKDRLASPQGMSCAEFTYQMFQAYDWLYLLSKYNCRFQIGGCDQMGNIKSGHDLINRLSNKSVYGLIVPLILTESGEKLGKSSGNSIWLNSAKSSPFSHYQYWLRQKDADVGKLLRLFTFLSQSEIDQIEIEYKTHPEKRPGQKALAKEVTLLVHGEEGLRSAEKVTNALYGGADILSKLSCNELAQVFEGAKIINLIPEPGITVFELAMKAKCFTSEHDAHRIITAGGFYINNQRVKNINEVLVAGVHILPNKSTLVRVGKKNYHIIQWLM